MEGLFCGVEAGRIRMRQSKAGKRKVVFRVDPPTDEQLQRQHHHTNQPHRHQQRQRSLDHAANGIGPRRHGHGNMDQIFNRLVSESSRFNLCRGRCNRHQFRDCSAEIHRTRHQRHNIRNDIFDLYNVAHDGIEEKSRSKKSRVAPAWGY